MKRCFAAASDHSGARMLYGLRCVDGVSGFRLVNSFVSDSFSGTVCGGAWVMREIRLHEIT